MKLVVEFDIDADIIECPDYIINDIFEQREKFLDWLFNKHNDHQYWWYENGEKYGCCYRSEAFVDWLNKFILSDSLFKVKVVESYVTEWDRNLPSISF